MNYFDLEHLSKSLDRQVKALSDYKALVDQQIEATNENLDAYKNDNAFNLSKLKGYVVNGVSLNDLNEDLQNSIAAAKNAGIDITELLNKDIYLDNIKANKEDVYNKNESDRKLSEFYTRNEIDEKVTSLSNLINDSSSMQELSDALNAYMADSNLLINELNKQLNSLKSSLPDVHNIESIETISDLEVEVGSDISNLLKEKITVTLDNGDIRNITTTWQINSFNKDVDGTYTLTGILNLPDDVSNTKNLVPVVNVIVIGEAVSIKSVDELNDAYVEYASDISDVLAHLPVSVGITLSDDTRSEATITWNMNYYSSTSINDQIVTGKLNVDDGIINPKELTASIKIKIINHNIVSVENVEQTYERNYSIEFSFPQVVTVTLDDNTTRVLGVTWETQSLDTTKIGQTTVEGTFTYLPINITNTNNVKVLLTLNIIENQRNISLVGKIADVKVPLNTSFDEIDLASQTNVTLVNGETVQCNIIWDQNDYNGTVPGNYYIYGTLSNSTITNFNNFSIECVITVDETEYVVYAWSHKFIVPSGASQVANFQTKLGETFSDDDFYGPYNEENDDYDYTKRKIEMFYLGSTLQEPNENTIILDDNISNEMIKKTGIIDLYGSNGLRIPLGSYNDEAKNSFDTKVAAAEESSIRSVDFYAGDLLTFENKTSSNQIFLIRKIKHSYVQ